MKVVEVPNLVDQTWGPERPKRPQSPVFHLEEKYTGQSSMEKYQKVAEEIKEADCLLISTLDDICWLLNLRGNDIAFNPVFFAYVIFWPKDLKVTLFVDDSKIADVKDYLQSIQVSIKPYDVLAGYLHALADTKTKIAFDTKKANAALHKIVKDSMFEVSNVVASIKCEKNPVESEGMRQANIRDCAAIMKYFSFLEEELRKPNHGLDEFVGALKVKEYRAQHSMFKQLSFPAISSIGPNGAVIHYKPE